MTTMTTSTTTTAASGGHPSEIDPAAAKALLDRGEAVLVDVRDADEHARERIPGATLLPLSTLAPEKVAALGAKHVLVHCKSGRRSADAAMRCSRLVTQGVTVTSVRGGIEAWRSAGLPTVVESSRPRLGVMQQTQLVIGLMALTGTALGAFVSPWFLIVPGFMGAGLVMAGTTGLCPLASLLAVMPWNRVPSQCSTDSTTCCR